MADHYNKILESECLDLSDELSDSELQKKSKVSKKVTKFMNEVVFGFDRELIA